MALAACTTPAARVEGASRPASDAVGSVELVTLSRAPRLLRDEAAGRPALVSLWATWCDACTKEIDALNRLDDGARKKGGLVIGVDEGETIDDVKAFASARGMRYALLLDADFRLGDAIGPRRVPTTIVLDRMGRVVYSGGALDEGALAAFRSALGSP